MQNNDNLPAISVKKESNGSSSDDLLEVKQNTQQEMAVQADQMFVESRSISRVARGRNAVGAADSALESCTSNDTALEEFSTRPCVQHALHNPWYPNSVLSFFTGIDCADPKSYKELLSRTKISQKMYPIIKHGGDRYYKLCQPFAPVIRAAGGKELVSSDNCDWNSVDGIVAQIVLCSQLARSCFRGTPEAYAYNDVSVALSQELHKLANSSLKQKTEKADYKKLRKSFASMSILAATYSPSSEMGGRRSRTRLAGARISGSQRSNASSRMTPPDCITMNSSSCVSPTTAHSLPRSTSSGSISTVSLDEPLDELDSIAEGGEEEQLIYF